MLNEIGGLIGWGIVICYGIALLNTIFKIVNKKFGTQIRQNEKVKVVYQWVMKFVVKYHRLFGSLTFILLALHFIIQYLNTGVLLTGIIAGVFLIVEVINGVVGSKKKWKANKIWLGSHRMLGVMMGIAVISHLIFK